MLWHFSAIQPQVVAQVLNVNVGQISRAIDSSKNRDMEVQVARNW